LAADGGTGLLCRQLSGLRRKCFVPGQAFPFFAIRMDWERIGQGIYIVAMKESISIPAGYYSYIERVWLFFNAPGSFC